MHSRFRAISCDFLLFCRKETQRQSLPSLRGTRHLCIFMMCGLAAMILSSHFSCTPPRSWSCGTMLLMTQSSQLIPRVRACFCRCSALLSRRPTNLSRGGNRCRKAFIGWNSADVKIESLHAGMIDYWTAEGHAFPEQEVDFTVKLETDLYALAKAKTGVQSLEVSRDGSQFATISADRQISPGCCKGGPVYQPESNMHSDQGSLFDASGTACHCANAPEPVY